MQRDGRLVLADVDWKIPRWTVEGDGPHSVAGKLREWDADFQADCVLWGAFDGDVLVGFSAYRPRITETWGSSPYCMSVKRIAGRASAGGLPVN